MGKDKRIYFFDNQQDWERFKEKKKCKIDILCGHLETQEAIENNEILIISYDLSSLYVKLFEYGYRIFLKQKGYQMIEIKLGGYNNWTSKQIRMSDNLLKMYQKGQMTLYLRKL